MKYQRRVESPAMPSQFRRDNADPGSTGRAPTEVALSPEAARALQAGLESAKHEPIVYSDEDFSQYANDDE